jgi:hypothetical protein
MGEGINVAREQAPVHTAVLDDLKDQLVIVLIKRLADANGNLVIPVSEIDDTGSDMLAFRVDPDTYDFHFQTRKKN